MNVTAVYDDEIVEAAKEEADRNTEGTPTRVLAYDITFSYEDDEIEPECAISVKIIADAINAGDDAKVVHVDDQGDASIVNNADISGNEATFVADSFSVYVIIIIDDPEEVVYRRTYKFFDIDDSGNYVPYLFENENSELVDNQIIKEGDKLAALDTPYHSGKEFQGWYIWDSSAGAYGAKVELETEIHFDPALTEDEVVEVRAKYTNHYLVTYLDETGSFSEDPNYNGAVIKTDEVTDENGTYTINATYVPKSQDSAFLGWIPLDNESASHLTLVSGESEPAYTNGSVVTITGNVVFKVYNPEGHWLIFEENAKGASYTPSQFIKNGDVTHAPAKNPTRKGYDFKGWYTGKPAEYGGEPTGELFTFETEISAQTTLYAKWEPYAKADFTVIIWKEDLSGQNVYEEAVIVKNATANQPVSGIIVNRPDCSVTISGTKYEYIGFRPKEQWDRDKIVSPAGDTVVNLYFERIEYTLKFYYARSSGNNYYLGTTNDRTYTSSSVRGFTRCAGTQTDTKGDAGGNYTYYYYPVTAKYGADISGMWPTYDMFDGNNTSNYRLVSWIMMPNAGLRAGRGNANGYDTVKGLISTMDESVLETYNGATGWKDPEGNWLHGRFIQTSPTNYTYQLYFEPAEGQDLTGLTVRTKNGKTYYLRDELTVEARSTSGLDGQKAPEFPGFKPVMKSATAYDYDTEDDTTIRFYYDRINADIVYMNGSRYDGNGAPMPGSSAGQLKLVEGIHYGSKLNSYNTG
ncbi:MAG: InlB B-repeat-containing protein, partial [Lachnospiraceae bacterium]|nr:InlB B-repeat-containing protein [Lachnospiraceae bacterium]